MKVDMTLPNASGVTFATGRNDTATEVPTQVNFCERLFGDV